MIAKLIFFVLKSSFFVLNATLLSVILIGCSQSKKKKDTYSPPPEGNSENQIRKQPNQNSTASTEKEAKTPNSASTPSQPISKPKSPAPDEKQKSQLKLDKTQQLASKESLRPPPRTLRGAPINIKSREAQKTMKDVKEMEVSARDAAPINGEKSTNQQEFDDYLNNLGENK